jgi:hypothetical protein
MHKQTVDRYIKCHCIPLHFFSSKGRNIAPIVQPSDNINVGIAICEAVPIALNAASLTSLDGSHAFMLYSEMLGLLGR